MFLADFGAYDVQFEGFGGDYVFWAGSAQSEGRVVAFLFLTR